MYNFLWRSVKGFGGEKGSNFPFSHWLASSPLQHSRTTVRVCDYRDWLDACHVHLYSMGVAWCLFDRWRCGPDEHNVVITRCESRPFWPVVMRVVGRVRGQLCELIIAALVWCFVDWLVLDCGFHFLLFYVLSYFIIILIKHNDLSFLSLGWEWTPSRVERETRQCLLEKISHWLRRFHC